MVTNGGSSGTVTECLRSNTPRTDRDACETSTTRIKKRHTELPAGPMAPYPAVPPLRHLHK